MDIRKVIITIRGDARIFSDGTTGRSIQCAFEEKICSPDCAACFEEDMCTKVEPFRPFVAVCCSRIQKCFQSIGEIREI